MGLDMYLHKKTYVGWNWEHRIADLKNKKLELPDLSGFGIDAKRVSTIEEQVGYWRKANAIHAWFVKNVQDGNDDCRDAYVSEKKMKELLTLVTELLIKRDVNYAAKMLPPQPGFFFGTYEIDENYWEDLEYTQKLLTECLESDADTFYYNSSW